MPSFDNVEIDVNTSITVDIDFEVYCNTCGAGLCGESETRQSRNRKYLQVSVNACPHCMKEKDNEIEDLKNKISELEALID